jgi:hypothetical protein
MKIFLNDFAGNKSTEGQIIYTYGGVNWSVQVLKASLSADVQSVSQQQSTSHWLGFKLHKQ